MILFFCGDTRRGRISAKIFKTKRLKVLTGIAQSFFENTTKGRGEGAQIGRFKIGLVIFDGLE